MIALDENALISAQSYAHITTPFVLNNGHNSAYGLGWSTQKVAGHPVHWHYGFDDAYSALLVRLPETKTSFIFLSNTGGACAPFWLGSCGNVLASSFAAAFLSSELPGKIAASDQSYSPMLLEHYSENVLGYVTGGTKTMLNKLRSADPERFRKNDRVLISLISDLADLAFSNEMDSLARAYHDAGDYHPDISFTIADYYGTIGQQDKCETFLRQVADTVGYEEWSAREACIRLGAAFLRNGRTQEGRKYLWRVVQDAQMKGETIESQDRLAQPLKRH